MDVWPSFFLINKIYIRQNYEETILYKFNSGAIWQKFIVKILDEEDLIKWFK